MSLSASSATRCWSTANALFQHKTTISKLLHVRNQSLDTNDKKIMTSNPYCVCNFHLVDDQSVDREVAKIYDNFHNLSRQIGHHFSRLWAYLASFHCVAVAGSYQFGLRKPGICRAHSACHHDSNQTTRLSHTLASFVT